MNQEEKRFFEVEAYLRNEMTPEESAAFQAKMAADPALAKQVAEQKALQSLDSLFVEDDLRASIREWQSEPDIEDGEPQPVPPPAPKGPRFPVWGLLGLAAALAVGAWYFWPDPAETPAPPATTPPVQETPIATDTEPVKVPQQEAPPKENAPQKEQPPKTTPQGNELLALATRFEEVPAYAGGDVRSGSAPASGFERAMEHLGKKELDKAAALFRALPQTDEHWQDAQYNLGSLLYQQKKFSPAIPFLKTAAENADFLYADHARWYLTLSLLASGKAQESKAQLEVLLSQPKGDFYQKARELAREGW